MRIISGALGGRSVRVPKNAAFRPTSDRVKEAVFNVLTQHISWEECSVCDLYAGSGSLGLEALSRGALHATFVENNRGTLATLRSNIDAFGIDRASVESVSVTSYIRSTRARFDLVFADPPYADPAVPDLPGAVAHILHPHGLFVLEHASRVRVTGDGPLQLETRRDYGDTTVSIFRHGERP